MTLRPARVELRVERLVLEGVRPGDRERVAAAFARELSRLVAGRVPAAFAQGGRITALDAGPFTLASGTTPEAAGAGIARAVYAGLDRAGRAAPATDGGRS